MADEANDDQTLEMILKTRIQGAEEIEAGVAASNRFATAENRAERAIRSATGIYERRIRIQKELNEAIAKGESVERQSDLRLAKARNQKQIDKAEKPNKTAGDSLRDSIFSTRFSMGHGMLGNVQPLIGRSLEAINPDLKKGVGDIIKRFGDRAAGGVGKSAGGEAAGTAGAGAAEAGAGAAGEAAGGMGAIAGAAGEAVEALGALVLASGPAAPIVIGLALLAGGAAIAAGAMIQAATAAAEITQKFSDLQSRVGGSGIDAAQARIMSRVTGVDAGSASRSLRERITTDGMAMGIAAKYGVSAQPGVFGKRNFGQQYQQLIERLSSSKDKDGAMREADQLGIGQEVQRYQLLSTSTKQRLKDTASTSAHVNSPAAQRRAAELEAAMQNLGEASDNLKTAWGDLFNGTWMPDLINGLAGVENWLADKLSLVANAAHGTNLPGIPGGTNSSASGGGGSGSPTGSSSLDSQQLQATLGLTEAINQNTRTIIGGGPNANAALPSGMRGQNLSGYAQAVNQGLVHLGSLG